MRPNIVWVSLESLRYDHTSLGGTPRDQPPRHTTPFLQAHANDPMGRSFDLCFSNAIWTRTSVASILTGTHPSHHGAGVDQDCIPDDLPTVAERFRDGGYHTVVHAPTQLDVAGVKRGFEDVRSARKPAMHKIAGLRPFLSYLRHLRTYSGGLTLEPWRHDFDYLKLRGVERTLDRAADADRPVFMYTHFQTSHHAYNPPLPYLERYTQSLSMSAEEALDVVLDMSDHLTEHIATGCQFPDREWEAILALYHGAIAYNDFLVGRLFEFLWTSDLRDTVVVVTGDHGELFGERGLLSHKLVTHDATCHVPLVVNGPTDLLDYDGELVQHIDVIQTLAAENGIETAGMQGLDLRYDTRDHCIIQRGGRRGDRNLEAFEAANPSFDGSRFHRGLLTALRTTEFKYEYSDSGERLYQLPDETTDVADQYPDVCSKFRREVEAFLEQDGRPQSTEVREVTLNAGQRKRLEQLGYLVD